MKAKEYMESVRKAERELKTLNLRRRHYMDLATSISVSGEPLNNKPSGGSRVETAVLGIIDLTTALDVKAREYTELIQQAESLVSKIRQDKFRQVLTLRYFTGLSWKSISDEMNYKDPKSVFRVHGYALAELQHLL